MSIFKPNEDAVVLRAIAELQGTTEAACTEEGIKINWFSTPGIGRDVLVLDEEGYLNTEGALQRRVTKGEQDRRYLFPASLHIKIGDRIPSFIKWHAWGALMIYTEAEELDMSGFPHTIFNFIRIYGPNLKKIGRCGIKRVGTPNTSQGFRSTMTIVAPQLAHLDLRNLDYCEQFRLFTPSLETLKLSLDYTKTFVVNRQLTQSPLYKKYWEKAEAEGKTHKWNGYHHFAALDMMADRGCKIGDVEVDFTPVLYS